MFLCCMHVLYCSASFQPKFTNGQSSRTSLKTIPLCRPTSFFEVKKRSPCPSELLNGSPRGNQHRLKNRCNTRCRQSKDKESKCLTHETDMRSKTKQQITCVRSFSIANCFRMSKTKCKLLKQIMYITKTLKNRSIKKWSD